VWGYLVRAIVFTPSLVIPYAIGTAFGMVLTKKLWQVLPVYLAKRREQKKDQHDLKILGYLLMIVFQSSAMDVTQQPNAVTLFSTPLPNIGLLAHDYLAGKLFYELEIGDTVEVNGQVYRVSKIRTFTWDADHAWLLDRKGNKWAEWSI